MRVALLGSKVDPALMREALAAVGADPTADAIRQHGALVWGQIADPRDSQLKASAQRLGGQVTVIEVELPAGGRGAGLFASRYLLSRGGSASDQCDLTREAKEILHDWLADGRGGFDEEVAALELAWELATDLDDDDGSAAGESLNVEDRWAETLLAHLVTTKAIELKARCTLTLLQGRFTDAIAHQLSRGIEDSADLRDTAVILLEWFVDCKLVEEVFIDEEGLAQMIVRAKPSA